MTLANQTINGKPKITNKNVTLLKENKKGITHRIKQINNNLNIRLVIFNFIRYLFFINENTNTNTYINRSR